MKMIKKVTNSVLNILHRLRFLLRTNEEGRTIRKTRLRKFRTKNKKLLIATKIVAIWYLLILSGSYLTSDTGAYFNDVEVIENSLHVSWDNDDWDNSSLDFKNSKVWTEGCTVNTTIKNAGEDMTFSTWRYDLYKVVNGNVSAEPVATGVVPNINSMEWGTITTTVTEDGVYRFAVRRPLNHPGNNNPDENGYSYIWSDNKISVTGCTSPQEPPVNDDGDKESPVPVETNVPLTEVANLEWESMDKGNSGKFLIKWTNPDNSIFNHVKVYVGDKVFSDNITNQQIEIIAESTATTYRITSVDNAGKETAGIKILVSKEGISKE